MEDDDIKNYFELLNNLIIEVNDIDAGCITQLSTLLSPEFIMENSSFNDLDELIIASGLKSKYLNSKDLFSSEEWGAFIIKNTIFYSWNEMKIKAAIIYIKYKLPNYL